MVSAPRKEKSVASSDIREVLANIKKIADELQNKKTKTQEDQFSLLGDLRECTVGLNILNHIEELDSWTVAVLYLSETLINDFWKNLGGDASFGFEEIMDDVSAFSKQLGRFLSAALGESDRKQGLASTLFESIALYYSCLSHMRNKSEQIFQSSKR